MTITGKTTIAAVIGHPISHSRSPLLHGYWLEKYGIDGALVPLDIRPEEIDDVLRTLPKLGLIGASVTLPFKEAALKQSSEVDPAAKAIGAVNMLTIGAEGQLIGRNTDAFGFIENLREKVPAWSAERGTAVVLGAGGAARAAAYALAEAGAPEVRLINRTRNRAEEIARHLETRFSTSFVVADWADRDMALADAAALVNATSLGMSGRPELPLDLDALPPTSLVTDLVYSPLMTPLLAMAKRRGNDVVDGLGMLIHQARPAFQTWFGIDPEVTEELRFKLEADLGY